MRPSTFSPLVPAFVAYSGIAGAQSMPGCPPEYPAAADLWPSRLGTERDSTRDPTAAGRFAGFMGWSANVPIGDVRSFTSNISPLGFELQFRVFAARQLALGLSVEWVAFLDERSRETYSVRNVDLTAATDNQVQTVMGRALLQYYLLQSGAVLPYIGAHAGVGWVAFEADIADRDLVESGASVLYGGDLGAEIPLGVMAPVLLANIRYSSLPQAELWNLVDGVQTAAFSLAIGF